MKSLTTYITEKLKISKASDDKVILDVDPKVEKAIKKIFSELSLSLIITNKAVKNFYEATRKVSTPGIRFFKWNDYYDMTSGKNYRDLSQNESNTYYKENGQIVVTDNDNKRIVGLMFVHSLSCQFLDMKEDTYLVILSSDPIILNKEAYEDVVRKAISQKELYSFDSSSETKTIKFDDHEIKNTDIVSNDFLRDAIKK